MRLTKILFIIVCFAFLLLQFNNVLAYECNKASVGYKHVYSVSKGYDPDYAEKVKSEKGFALTPPYTIFDELEFTFKFGLNWEPTNCPFMPADTDPDLLQGDLCRTVVTLEQVLNGNCSSLDAVVNLAAYVELNGTLYRAGTDYARYFDVEIDSTTGGTQKMGIGFKGIPDEVMEEFISKIDRDGKIKIKLYGNPSLTVYSLPPMIFRPDDISDPNYYGYYRLVDEIEIPMTNCVHVSGDGKHKVVVERSSPHEVESFKEFYQKFGVKIYLSPFELILKTERIDEGGFRQIDPFKTYIDEFSFYADLRNFLSDWHLIKSMTSELVDRRLVDKIAYYSFYGYLKEDIKEKSSCKDGKAYVILANNNNSRMGGGGAVVEFGDGKVYLSYDEEAEKLFSIFSAGLESEPRVVIHEIGHAFCGINDEYLYDKNFLGRSEWNKRILRKNCALVPQSDYRGTDNNIYGSSNFKGCTLLYKASRDPNPNTWTYFYRPTEKSLMRTTRANAEKSDKFNVVSCGYCLAAIKGGNPKSYFVDCSNMDVEPI